MSGIISTVIGIFSLVFAWLLGRLGTKSNDSQKNKVVQLQARLEAQTVETSSARKAEEVVSSIAQGNLEREMSNTEISHKLADAALYGEVDKVYELAGILADRAAETIKRNTNR